MKKWKNIFLTMLCVGMLLGMTACGANGNNENDNAANDMTTEQNDTNKGTEDESGVGGAVDEIGNAVGDGINDVGDGIEEIADDVTEEPDVNDVTDGTSDKKNHD